MGNLKANLRTIGWRCRLAGTEVLSSFVRLVMKMAHKDMTLATELGRELGVPMRVANLALAEMTDAMNRGWAERDSRVSMLLQQERSGVEIAVPRDRIREVTERDG